jgi:serine/threonine protein kinase
MPETPARYTLLNRLGAGGLGELYRARDTALGRTVALRILSPDIFETPERREAFLLQAHAAAALSHPNIAGIHEVVNEGGSAFLAQEFVSGETLARLSDGRALYPRRAVGYAIQIADALADAHAMGIEHGHLTGGSVLVTPKGHVKVVDFGLAAWTSPAREAEPTSDLVALGRLLTALAGTTSRPHATDEAMNAGGMVGAIGRIVTKLQLGSDGGYESAATAAADLRAIVEAFDAKDAAAPMTLRQASGARRPTWLWLIVLLGLLGVGVLVWAAVRA